MLRANTLARGLFPHQVEGVAFLLDRRRAILADDMGLGKTRQAIVALRALAEGPFLVICPASLKHNWAREIRLVDPEATISLLDAPAVARQSSAGKSPSVKKSLSARPADGSSALSVSVSRATWTIINYDRLKNDRALLQQAWCGIVIDEAHYIKNHQSQRSQQVRRLVAQASPGCAVFALTGTPLANRPRDLFPLLQLVDHPLGRSFLSFAKRYCAAQHNGFGWVTDGASHLEELRVQLQGVLLRRTKDEVLALPPKLRHWLEVEVPTGVGTAGTRTIVQQLLTNQGKARQHRTRQRGAAGQQRERTRLQAHLTTVRQEIAIAKVESSLEWIEAAVEQGEKVLVFSCFDQPVAQIAEHFGKAAVRLTGRTPVARRQQVVDRFQQDQNVRIVVANLQVGGTGLNLTAARQVLFNDLDWVPANHWQAEDRAYRIGQSGMANVTYLVARNTIDEFAARMLGVKAALSSAVIDGRVMDYHAVGNSHGSGEDGQDPVGAALRGELSGDIFEDLEQALIALSPRLAEVDSAAVDEELVLQLLRESAERYEAESTTSARASAAEVSAQDAQSASASLEWQAREAAMQALLRVLRGEGQGVTRYRCASRSGSGFYSLHVVGGDVRCSCPGFEYRGQCSHARGLKAALAAGEALPDGVQAVE
jgi:SWI/SNF-related matrix-associated actin-dependent regulator 1 of chromatin subfamily A